MNGEFKNDQEDYFYKYRNETLFNDKKSIELCFRHFSKNENAIDLFKFEALLKSLFSFNENSYFISKLKIKNMFNYFDSNKNEALSYEDFESFWFKIVKQTLFARSALLVVDVQNDFIDGTLALKNCSAKHNGGEVVPIINELINEIPFDVIAYTLDWHPEDHSSFIENIHKRKISSKSPVKNNFKTFDTVIFEDYPNIEQKLWPAHCIQNSNGAKLHPDLTIVDENTDKMKRKVVFCKKGSKSDIDSYSAFFDNCKLNETTLNSDLKKHGITDLYVCGLAADVCVAATSFDGLELDYRVIFLEDATRGVDCKHIDEQKKNLVNNGCIIVNSKQVYNMVTRLDRRPELGYATFSKLTS